MRNIPRHFTVREGITKSWTQRWDDRLDLEVAVVSFFVISILLCLFLWLTSMLMKSGQGSDEGGSRKWEYWHFEHVEDLKEDLVWLVGHQGPSSLFLWSCPQKPWAPWNPDEGWSPPLHSPGQPLWRWTSGQCPKWVFIHLGCSPHRLANICNLKPSKLSNI